MNRNSEKEFRNRIIVRHKHSFLVVSKVALYLVLIALLDLSRIFANAKTKLDRDFYSSSGELVDVFRMEQDLVRIDFVSYNIYYIIKFLKFNMVKIWEYCPNIFIC